MSTRKSWWHYFMDMARQAATRATCLRKRVGCVIVRDNRVLVTGYNGSLPGEPHCEDVGCLMDNNHCVRTNHAEANAVAQAAKYGISLADAVVFCTLTPCGTCDKLLASAGVREVIYAEEYPSKKHSRLLYYKLEEE